jgi:membrane protein CcdC involved in cytochrome C biogenesis
MAKGRVLYNYYNYIAVFKVRTMIIYLKHLWAFFLIMVGLVVEELGAQTVVDEKLIVFDLCTYLKGSILKPISR